SSHPTSQIFISPLSTSPPPSSPTHASFTEDSTYSSSNYDYYITEFNLLYGL
ncbi:7289_t:CDS:1, partial [Rhizophagus irregularis]